MKYRVHNALRQANLDNLAFMQLQPLINGFGYIPLTGSSLRPSSIVTVVNDVIINQRKNVIEFGSGISTMVLAKLASLPNYDFVFTSIEEDKDWFDFMSSWLSRNGLAENVRLIYSPIESQHNNTLWHNLSFLEKIESIDCMLVDGPKAFSVESKNIRSFALDAVQSKLGNSFSIFLDDCHRLQEKKIFSEWSTKLALPGNIYYQHLGVIFKGSHYNISI